MGGGRHSEGRRPLQHAGRRDKERQVESCEGAGKVPRDCGLKCKIIIIIIIIINSFLVFRSSSGTKKN